MESAARCRSPGPGSRSTLPPRIVVPHVADCPNVAVVLMAGPAKRGDRANDPCGEAASAFALSAPQETRRDLMQATVGLSDDELASKRD